MFDVVSIGNATHDVFVKIKSLKVKHCGICFQCGEKQEVDDIFHATGGGATNTAVSFKRLGLRAAVLCALGKDESANMIAGELKKEGISTNLVERFPNSGTAYSVILTGFGGDRIILTYKGATEHLADEGKVRWGKLKKTKWFYITSFHSKREILRKIFSFAEKNRIKIAFNPGKAEIRQGLAALKPMLSKSEILFVNESESEMLTGKKDLMQSLKLLQKAVPIAVITEGKKGVHVFDGCNYYFKKTYAIKEVDTTGAGDAFNSAFTTAIIKGKSIKEAMDWGMAQAQSVILQMGAKNKLLTQSRLREFMKKWETGETKVKIKEI